jgi:alkanesulfonate monooxygenase SsuD/methylene tetrahydromethanopterin reductase-like flavin-dependent oxidoreductase (luciferase family)
MTRSKSTPPVHKPAFDEESALRFAAQGSVPFAGAAVRPVGDEPAGGPIERLRAKSADTDRLSITLMLKSEVIARLKEEAARREKTIDQIVEKLVAKHLGKH